MQGVLGPDVASGGQVAENPVPLLALVGFAAVAVAILLLGETEATLDRPTVAVVWGGLALAAYLAGLLCLTGARYDDGLGIAHWKMGPWILLWYSIAFGAVTVAWSQPRRRSTLLLNCFIGPS